MSVALALSAKLLVAGDEKARVVRSDLREPLERLEIAPSGQAADSVLRYLPLETSVKLARD